MYYLESGSRSLFNTAMENFPVNFIPLSMIANALATTGPIYSKYVSTSSIISIYL